MQTSPNLFQTVWGAFLLRGDVYTGMRDDAQRMRRAIVLLLVVGLLVGVAGTWSQLVDWSFSPDLAQIQSIVLTHLQRMPWYTELQGEPEFVQQFSQVYAMVWQVIQQVSPSPLGAVANIFLTPITLLVVWLVYGLLAYLAARVLGGQGSLGQTLACTALAAAPQLLNLIMVIPYASAAGVSTWTLMCNFMAIRAVHGLTTWRTLAAVLLPLVLLILVGMLFACVGLAVGGPLIASWMGGAQ